MIHELHTRLLEIFREATHRPVGDESPPKSLDERSPGDYPFAVVSALDTPWWRMDGPIGRPQADTRYRYYVIVVGQTADQVRYMVDQLRPLYDDTMGKTMDPEEEFEVPGLKVSHISLDTKGGVARDDTLQPPVYHLADTIELWTTPTGD